MKVGIVFAGQGAQYEGMGKDLYDNYKRAREIFDEAGEDIKNWCFNGDKETLRLTNITQPTVYTVTMAAYEAFMEAAEEAGLRNELDIVALGGFSLGEYASLTVAGCIDDISKGLDVVKNRGKFMEEAGLDEDGNHKGSMVATMGDRATIEECVEIAKKGRILEAVNYNSPKQTVVAGELSALDDYMEVATAHKLKPIKLSVGTAFHCEMMKPAAERLLPILKEVGFKAPRESLTVYSNITAEDIMKDYDGGDVNDYLANIMSRQVASPVYFEDIVHAMAKEGVEVIVEVGPGKTLSKLVGKTEKDIKTFNIEDKTSLEETIAGLKEVIGC